MKTRRNALTSYNLVINFRREIKVLLRQVWRILQYSIYINRHNNGNNHKIWSDKSLKERFIYGQFRYMDFG